MSGSRPGPAVKQSAGIEYEAVGAADGMSKGVLVSEADGVSNFATRRLVFDPDASILKHTNEAEHEQCALSGRYVVGIGDEEYEVEAGNSLLIPAGAVHWYRNEFDAEGAFLCAVPNGNDAIELAADADA